MATYPFLSDEWVTEAHKLREESKARAVRLLRSSR